MAGFGLLYNQTDITNMMAQAQATVDRMPPGDRALFNAVWSGGLSSWGTAPDAPAKYQAPGSTDPVKVINVNAKQGNRQITMEDFCAMLERMAAANPPTVVNGVETDPGASFLISVADDIRHAGGVEPWPSA